MRVYTKWPAWPGVRPRFGGIWRHQVLELRSLVVSAARRPGRLAVAATLIASAVALGVFGLGNGQAFAHGSLQSPPSRIYACRQEGPEHPRSAACQAAVAAGGTQALYDWNGVAQMNAGAYFQHVVPDGQLCSAGNPEFKGFDLARNDWPATTLSAGASFQFVWAATAPHQGSFRFYVTKDGYDPGQPLGWSDLEPQPFLIADHLPLVDGEFRMAGQLPAHKRGRHVIYTVYTRSDSSEDFFSCSDVIFNGDGVVRADAAPDAAPTDAGTAASGLPSAPSMTDMPGMTMDMPGMTVPSTLTPSPDPVAPASPGVTGSSGDVPGWHAGSAYPVGAQVSYGGVTYVCMQAHRALPGWEPPNVPVLWQAVPPTSSDGALGWVPTAYYSTGSIVSYNGGRYICLQGHRALPGWEPPNAPTLWEPVG